MSQNSRLPKGNQALSTEHLVYGLGTGSRDHLQFTPWSRGMLLSW